MLYPGSVEMKAWVTGLGVREFVAEVPTLDHFGDFVHVWAWARVRDLRFSFECINQYFLSAAVTLKT